MVSYKVILIRLSTCIAFYKHVTTRSLCRTGTYLIIHHNYSSITFYYHYAITELKCKVLVISFFKFKIVVIVCWIHSDDKQEVQHCTPPQLWGVPPAASLKTASVYFTVTYRDVYRHKMSCCNHRVWAEGRTLRRRRCLFLNHILHLSQIWDSDLTLSTTTGSTGLTLALHGLL